ncbi:recombinase family protein [Roseococcus sp.]|uniref:recombinase family protein n=1 Tax=Roseococcus sp. TaxID=2109646 RepID=UPI003BAC2D62
MNSTPRTFVAYLRVSTDKQGRSGLGREAQEAAINGFLRPGDRLLCPTFVEVESGRKSDRPELAKALERCRRTGATLLVAKLDRLARDVHFISGLIKQGVPFIATDYPDTDRFMLHIRATVAEEEARMIATRTKAALAAAKARGTKLGGIREGQRPLTREEAMNGRELAAKALRRKADHFANHLVAHVETARASGAVSLREIAAYLNENGVPQPREVARAKKAGIPAVASGKWTATGVRNARLRVDAIQGSTSSEPLGAES